MKTLFIVLFVTILSFPFPRVQDLYSLEACFDSYAQGTYCFVDMEGTTYQFQDMDPIAMEKYDLTDGNYQGRMFTVVYRVEISVNEDGEEEEEQEGQEEEVQDEEEQEEEDDGEQDGYRENIIVDLEIVG
ncbi:MAG TPA: hypothetical protein VFD35_10035 [Pricia sp.]|nr:hypothetical protein [Pricia sp.]